MKTETAMSINDQHKTLLYSVTLIVLGLIQKFTEIIITVYLIELRYDFE